MRERASGLSRLLLLASLGIAFTPSVVPAGLAKATFAGGCFWCMQPPFDALEGVVSTTVGYTGGRAKNPTYEEVSAGGTGHTELRSRPAPEGALGRRPTVGLMDRP